MKAVREEVLQEEGAQEQCRMSGGVMLGGCTMEALYNDDDLKR